MLRRLPPTPRTLAVLASVLLTGIAVDPAMAAKPATEPFMFPVVGGATYFDDYGAPRSQGSHQGNDLMAKKRTPIVASCSGTVRFHSGARSGPMLYLRCKTREYVYIHLNNDRKGDDGKGGADTAYAPGLKDGDAVRIGQLIAFVGDSGDAENAGAHLHFEERYLGGGAVDPYERLIAAPVPLFATPAANARTASTGITLRLRGRVAWTATLPSGAGRLALRLTRVAVNRGQPISSRALIVLVVPAPLVAAATPADAIGDLVDVVTDAEDPTYRRQSLRAGSWRAATVAVRARR